MGTSTFKMFSNDTFFSTKLFKKIVYSECIYNLLQMYVQFNFQFKD